MLSSLLSALCLTDCSSMRFWAYSRWLRDCSLIYCVVLFLYPLVRHCDGVTMSVTSCRGQFEFGGCPLPPPSRWRVSCPPNLFHISSRATDSLRLMDEDCLTSLKRPRSLAAHPPKAITNSPQLIPTAMVLTVILACTRMAKYTVSS